jgi:hypothetical protein
MQRLYIRRNENAKAGQTYNYSSSAAASTKSEILAKARR